MKLHDWRRQKLMTMRDVAKIAGCGASTVYSIEAGTRTPSFTTIRKISAAMDVAPQEIDEFRAVIEDTSPRARKART